MYARLWWKDARQLWPIWVFLALAAVFAQWAAERYWMPASPPHALILLAILWASFYALAAGAAAFAGERETGTLKLLDIMPVERRVTWFGKVSFGLVTTLVLTGLLLGMATLGTKSWPTAGSAQALSPWDIASLTVIVVEALGWGLFWSAILNSALSAAVAAILCTGISCIFILARLDAIIDAFPDKLGQLASWQLGIAIIVAAASNVVFTRSGLPGRLRISLRSPIVVIRTGPPRRARTRLQLSSPGAATLMQAAHPRAAQVAENGRRASVMSRLSPRAWLVQSRALAWQTIREGRKTWFALAVIGLLGSALLFLSAGIGDATFFALAEISIALVAGVSVFGLENRAGTQRFLDHHAARPGLVWLVKLAVWCLGLVAVWWPQAILVQIALASAGLRSSPRPGQEVLVVLLALPIGFAVAQLCGMTIRRGITALIAAIILTLALASPLIVGIFLLILPLWGLLGVALALLAVSWAWSGDWLRNRVAPGRWVRLGLLLLGTGSVLCVAYVSYRVLSVPSVSLIAAPESWVKAASAMPPTDRNAAKLYREAGSRLNNEYLAEPAEYLQRNSETLTLIRRAAALPNCGFETLDRLTTLKPSDGWLGLPRMDFLAALVTIEAGERQKRGDLGGAWDDILLLFHMARHLGEGTAMRRSLGAWEIERDGLGLAMEWAIAPQQTPERLHAALAAYRALPRMVQAADVARAEAHLTEKMLSFPADKLRSELLSIRSGGEAWRPAWVDLITQPWEIARARRVNRILAAAFFQTAARDPFERRISSSSEFSTLELDYNRQSTPLADLLIADMMPLIEGNDRNEVGRRALVQVLALRAWQLRHGGQLPDRLQVLIPEELPDLPDDPYTGRPFAYIRSEGQILPSLRYTLWCWSSIAAGGVVRTNLMGQAGPVSARAPGYWLLYSVGPDFHDDHGRANLEPGGYQKLHRTVAFGPGINYDFVFPIPLLESSSTKRNEPPDQGVSRDRSSGLSQPSLPGPR